MYVRVKYTDAGQEIERSEDGFDFPPTPALQVSAGLTAGLLVAAAW